MTDYDIKLMNGLYWWWFSDDKPFMMRTGTGLPSTKKSFFPSKSAHDEQKKRSRKQ